MSQRIKKAFDGVVADEQLKQQTEDLVIRQIRRKQQAPFGRWHRVRVQAMLVFAILLTFTGFYVYQTPVSAVSVDSQASLEIRLNRFNRVVEVVGFDDQGKRLAAELRVKHLDFDAAIDEVLQAADSGTDHLNVTVASKHEACSGQMMANLESRQGKMKRLRAFQSTAETMDEAQAQGVTVGRMRAMHEMRKAKQQAPGQAATTDSTTNEMSETAGSHRQTQPQKGKMQGQGRHRMQGNE